MSFLLRLRSRHLPPAVPTESRAQKGRFPSPVATLGSPLGDRLCRFIVKMAKSRTCGSALTCSLFSPTAHVRPSLPASSLPASFRLMLACTAARYSLTLVHQTTTAASSCVVFTCQLFPSSLRHKGGRAICGGAGTDVSQLRLVVTILIAEWSGLPLAIVRPHSDYDLRVSNVVLPSISVGYGRCDVYEDIPKKFIEAEGQEQE
jgi:hypothetical protein